MKRDMDLIRQILLEVEAKESWSGEKLEISDYSAERVTYHLILLQEAGSLDLDIIEGWSNSPVHPTRLTWNGHEFLDAARDDSRWKRAKEKMFQVGGGLSFNVMKALLTQYLKDSVGLS